MRHADDLGLRVRLFGRFEVWREGALISPQAWGRRKTQSLLKLLLSERGRVFMQDQLIEALFPDLDPDKAIRNLYGRVSRLRHLLEPELERGGDSLFIPKVKEGYYFSESASCWIDTEEFQKACEAARALEEAGRWTQALTTYQQAIELYRGDYLAEDLYEEWTLIPRERWRALYLESLERLAECQARLGQFHRAIEHCRCIIELEPYNENAYRQLMRYHYHAGEQKKALQAYQACVQALKEHLEVAPERETCELQQQILSHTLPDPARVYPNNLPAPLTDFIGREREVAQVKQLLSASRLLTLTGVGGCGKTRLALQIASEVLAEFEEGVWLVELASLTEAALVPQALAAVLGLRGKPDQSLTETLSDNLRPKRVLLVLDNCEHLIESCAQLTEVLLRACPDLQVLATSREPLGLVGETTWPVPPLSLPDDSASLDRLVESDAVRLFIERARNSDPNFSLSQENAPAVAEICHRLDGLPLALELAAMRMRAFSAEQIARRLDDQLRLLTGGSRTALHQQTLRATMDWSFNLLTKAEQTLLCRLSVFRGGFTLEQVQAVCAGESTESSELLDLLTQLVSKSLVLAKRVEQARYSLLETVRQYAEGKLQAVPQEPDRLFNLHCRYYTEYLQRCETLLQDGNQSQALELINREIDNVYQAWKFAVTRGKATELLTSVDMFYTFHEIRGWFRRGRESAQGSLAAVQGQLHRSEAAGALLAKLLAWQGWFCFRLGYYGQARKLLRRSLALFRRIGDRAGIASSLSDLGLIAHNLGQFIEAKRLYEKSLELFRELDEPWERVRALSRLGLLLHVLGAYEEAKRLFQESMTLSQGSANRRAWAYSLCYLGWAEYALGDYSAALRSCQEGLSSLEEIGDQYGIALALAYLGTIERRLGHYEQARDFCQQSLAIFNEIGERGAGAYTLNQLGEACSALGDDRTAKHCFCEALKMGRAINKIPAMLESITGIAALLRGADRPECAVILLSFSLHSSASRMEDKARAKQLLAELKSTIPAEAIAIAQERGKVCTLEEIVAELLGEICHRRGPRRRSRSHK